MEEVIPMSVLMDILSPTNGENTAIENCPSTRVQTTVSDKEVTIAQFFRKFLEQEENAKYLYSLCTPSTNRIKNDTVLHYGDGFSTRVLFVPEESREDAEIVKGSIVLEMKVKSQNQVYDVLGREGLYNFQLSYRNIRHNPPPIFIYPNSKTWHQPADREKSNTILIHADAEKLFIFLSPSEEQVDAFSNHKITVQGAPNPTTLSSFESESQSKPRSYDKDKPPKVEVVPKDAADSEKKEAPEKSTESKKRKGKKISKKKKKRKKKSSTSNATDQTKSRGAPNINAQKPSTSTTFDVATKKARKVDDSTSNATLAASASVAKNSPVVAKEAKSTEAEERKHKKNKDEATAKEGSQCIECTSNVATAVSIAKKDTTMTEEIESNEAGEGEGKNKHGHKSQVEVGQVTDAPNSEMKKAQPESQSQSEPTAPVEPSPIIDVEVEVIEVIKDPKVAASFDHGESAQKPSTRRSSRRKQNAHCLLSEKFLKTTSMDLVNLEQTEFEREIEKSKKLKETRESTDGYFDDLTALPDAPPLLLDFPKTGKCIWTFDHKQRLLLANFNAGSLPNELTSIDEKFLLSMMERTDIVVVSEGLLKGCDEFLWDTDFIDMRAGDKLKDRNEFLGNPHCTLSGEEKELDIRCESSRIVNLDLKRILPETYDDFKANFLASELLPGGAHCMMNAVNPSGRPCLGPYLNYSLPGSFEQFCENDDGTLDRAHLCIDGHSEIIMLTRLEERRKRHAVHLLTGSHGRDRKQKDAEESQGAYHCDAEISSWPDKDAIKKCSEFQYCPCIFTVKPGQLLHVNKGRLCAIRAVACVPLSKEDCHYELRNQLLEEEEVKPVQMLTSISWNWMFLGNTYGGIKEEVACTLKNAKLSQSKREKSLGIPQRSLVALAKFHLPRYCQLKNGAIDANDANDANDDGGASLTIMRGIHDGLREVLSREIELLSEVRHGNESYERDEKLQIKDSTDSNQDSLRTTVDPFGNDFFCMLCNQELGNTYMHCDGCEDLLQKDFNICINCHGVKNMRQADHQMHPSHSLSSALGRRCDINHIPLQKKSNSTKVCGCNIGGSKCKKCKFMSCCSCKCHQQYTLRSRFYNENEMRSMLHNVDVVLNENDTIGSLNPPAEASQYHSNVRNRCNGIVTNHCDASPVVNDCDASRDV